MWYGSFVTTTSTQESIVTKQITIAGHQFEVATPYEEGQTVSLSKGEAHTLNQTRHENIRNNFAKKVKDAEEKGSFDQSTLQSEVSTYDQNYEFGVREGGVAVAVARDPVMTEARRLARVAIQTKLREAGRTDVSKEQLAAAVEKAIEANPHIVEVARERVEASRKAAEDLAGGISI